MHIFTQNSKVCGVRIVNRSMQLKVAQQMFNDGESVTATELCCNMYTTVLIVTCLIAKSKSRRGSKLVLP